MIPNIINLWLICIMSNVIADDIQNHYYTTPDNIIYTNDLEEPYFS